MKENLNNQIDIIIPAYNAQETIKRTLASIYMQTIRDDLHVIIVDDCTPDGQKSYQEIADKFVALGLDVKVISLNVNRGPGVARQRGIEAGTSQYFTCIDADDTFANAISLEIMREGMKQDNPQFPADSIKCVSATFIQLGDNVTQNAVHQNDIKEIA